MSDERFTTPRDILIHTDTTETERTIPIGGVDANCAPINAPSRTLSSITPYTMNKLSLSVQPSHDSKPSNGLGTPTEEARRAQGKVDSLAMSNATTPKESRHFASSSPLTKQSAIQLGNGLTRTISSEFGPTRVYSNTNLPPTEGSTESPTTPQWSAAVGKANLGKSGRVIERLMGENDMLKRDLNIERLRAEESNQAAKMTEAKMDALANEYETRLHDAAINKTLLKRRERQVADFKDQIETEKQKTAAAIDRELGWRQAMEKCEAESKQKVDDAQTFAALMEGRNNTMTSHWKEQGEHLETALAGLREKFDAIVEERRKDDVKFNMLKSLCDQQAEQLQALELEKDGIFAALEAYKAEQEFRLRDIKETAAAREKENDRLLEESKKLLGELKWALAVKENVK